MALAPEHPLAARETLDGDELRTVSWLRVPAPPGPWTDFWFPHHAGRPGPIIRTADEWVTAIEAGRGAAFTLPSVMRNFTTARVATVPVIDLPPGSVLLAWPTGSVDPLVLALLRVAEAALDGP